MTSNRMNQRPGKRTGLLSGPKRGLAKLAMLTGGAILLSACSGDTSDTLAQDESQDITLQQCEVARGGVVGTPVDPVVIDGVETQACLLNTDIAQTDLSEIGRVILKRTHNFERLVWVLDGVYEIGESKTYGSLAEFQEDGVFLLEADVTLYAREGSVVVVHRNGYLNADIESIDDNRTGGGEWGGLVINGAGWHPDCGADAGADNFCNVESPWGYFGGLSQTETHAGIQVAGGRRGHLGYVTEAGGEPGSGPALSAAVTVNALYKAGVTDGVYYSGKTGLELNGGTGGIKTTALGNQGHAIHWHSEFSGAFGGASSANTSIIHHGADSAALRGDNGGSGDRGVVIDQLTVVDQSLTGGTAIELAGGGDVSIDNLAVQGFAACLDIGDSATRVTANNSVFHCAETSLPAADGIDYGSQVVAQGESVYLDNPDLTETLAIDNPDIDAVDNAEMFPNNGTYLVHDYEFRLVYEPCYGAGTLLDETVNIGQDTYTICELAGQVDGNLYFDDDINGEKVAWRISGPVTFGSDVGALDAAAQRSALKEPGQVIFDGTSRVLMEAGAEFTVNPDVSLRVLGTNDDPVELQAGSGWGGMTINGLADSCASAEICELARQKFVDVNYLRLLNAGNGQPALVLNEVSAAGEIDHLDIADSAGDGLSLNGGAVNIDNLLVSGAAGNQVQWSDGYRGTMQYAILQPAENSLGHALHGRNNSDDHDRDPRSRPVMASITMKGSESADTAILLEQGSGLLLYNSVVTDFNTCLDIDHQATDDLQYTDPQQIHFDNVVLDCGATVPAEEEDGGLDFATRVQGQSGVYEEAAVLDSNFVATGPDIPAIEDSIDFTLAGASADHLEAGVDYMGSVRDSVDDWYLGWSDSIGIQLAAECDYKGVLENDYVFGSANVCGLRGTITEDFLLTAYTGEDRVAVENGTNVIDPDTGVERNPVKTRWLLNGLVRIGEGHLELADPAQVEAMKADPVTLGIEASALLKVTEGGGLHITRGGELVVTGGEDLSGETEPDDSSPVDISGATSRGNWIGLIVDGFARNNQCPEAATAEPGSRVCNIEGEYGYHGGYDDDHGNLHIENLNLFEGSLRLNSVGRGGKVENFYFEAAAGVGVTSAEEAWGAYNVGRAALDIDGGVVNLRNLNFNTQIPGHQIRWNHGYRGTMQQVSVEGSSMAGDPVGDFYENYYQQDGAWHAYPNIRGRNGDAGAGQDDALPRSAPTLVNVTASAGDAYNIFAAADYEVTSTALELSNGSGLYLYNSAVGGSRDDVENESHPFIAHNTAVDQCIAADQSVVDLLGDSVVFNQVAFACKEMSNDSSLTAAIDNSFATRTLANVPDSVSNADSVVPGEADADIYYFDWATGGPNPGNYASAVPAITLFTNWTNIKYPSVDVMNLGSAPLDYSTSQTVDTDFIVDTDYFGTMDYFIPIDAGQELAL